MRENLKIKEGLGQLERIREVEIRAIDIEVQIISST